MVKVLTFRFGCSQILNPSDKESNFVAKFLVDL